MEAAQRGYVAVSVIDPCKLRVWCSTVTEIDKRAERATGQSPKLKHWLLVDPGDANWDERPCPVDHCDGVVRVRPLA